MDSTYTPQSPDLSGFLPPDANPNKHQQTFHPFITSSGTSSLSSYAPRSPGIPHFGNGTIGTPTTKSTSKTKSRLSQPIQHLNYPQIQSNQSQQAHHPRFTANDPGNLMHEFPEYNTFHTTNQYMPPIPALPLTHSFGSQGTNLTTIGTPPTTATTPTTATAPQFYYPSHPHSLPHSHSDSLPHSHSHPQTIKSDFINNNNNSPIITSSSSASSHSQPPQPQPPQPHSQYLDQFQNTEATLSAQSLYDHRIPSPFTLGNDPVEIYKYNNNPQNPLYHESYTNQLDTTTRQPRQSRVKSQPITTASFSQSHTPQYQPKMSFTIAPQPPAAPPSNKNPNPDGIEIRTKFPVARIKRIMQADEEVGKVAQVTPVAVSKALELFMISLVQGAAKVAREKGGKRVTAGCLKRVVEENDQFDFLSEIVGRVQEVVPAAKEEKDGEGKKRKASAAKKEEGSESEVEPEVDAGEPKKKGRGKGKGGRKKKVEAES
ncbi:hypothetical protein BOTNAR_0018g00220 [Botryotinia narcissicola]|uniref:Transcription factor CBF/NF-Y/archaeal histone domain-containing protein n=1 Tax=Botryotinia narcissicola TaxID=278944 RepID=A0A4Z1JBM8_9HELO|nr:hypothetical protein BOTNAR_0018g00220 [Botryotinia narcissicola]